MSRGRSAPPSWPAPWRWPSNTIVRSLGWNLSELGSSVDRAFAELAAADVQGAVILAHSKGGLIGKAMLLDPRSDGVLRGMVAVATPFNGSALWKRAQASAAVTGTSAARPQAITARRPSRSDSRKPEA